MGWLIQYETVEIGHAGGRASFSEDNSSQVQYRHCAGPTQYASQRIHGCKYTISQIFSKHKKQFINSIEQIEESLCNYYKFLTEQVKLKNIDPKLEIKQAFQTIQSPIMDPLQYSQAVRKVSSLLNAKKDDGELTENDIIGSITTSNEQTRKKLQTNID